MNRDTVSAGPPPLANVIPFGGFASSQPDNAIELDSCPPFQWIVVTTRKSVYDIIVLSGDAGKVMVRGGRFFPEFRPVTIAGSTFGGSAMKLRTICVGLHLEVHVDGKSFVTSPIRTVSLGLPH
jgi:hypothetical protein